MTNFKEYRQLGLETFKKLYVNQGSHSFLQDTIATNLLRKLSTLPPNTRLDPFTGMWGEGKTKQEYRELTADRLIELITPLPDNHSADEVIDSIIRDLKKLPERPDGRTPYEGLFRINPSNDPTVMSISNKGLDLIKKYEGFVAKAYLCPANVWTIGYGTTRIKGQPVRSGMTCTKEEAQEWLKKDVNQFEAAVNKAVKVKLTQNQFDALVSFTYNVGSGALMSSTLLKNLNQGNYKAAADQLLNWNKGGGRVLAGLTRRREEERSLFLS